MRDCTNCAHLRVPSTAQAEYTCAFRKYSCGAVRRAHVARLQDESFRIIPKQCNAPIITVRSNVQPTQELVRQLFEYDPETGAITRKSSLSTNATARYNGAPKVSRKRYATLVIGGRQYKMSRVIFLYMTGRWPLLVDHINHDIKDHRWINLREVTHRQNSRNRPLNRNNTSGIHGVGWRDKDGRWAAQIGGHDGRWLGAFDTLFDAACARRSAELKLDYHPNHGNGKRPT